MNNSPAFPGKQKALMIQSEHVGIASEYEIEHNGMTLRDYFAAKAMAALASSPHATQDWINEHLAKSAWAMADAMLKAREA